MESFDGKIVEGKREEIFYAFLSIDFSVIHML